MMLSKGIRHCIKLGTPELYVMKVLKPPGVSLTPSNLPHVLLFPFALKLALFYPRPIQHF